MNLRWRFTSGIMFSLTIHALLIFTLVYAYPEIKNRGEWIWEELPLFTAEKKSPSISSFKDAGSINILSADKIIFPDLVIIRKQKNPLPTSGEKPVIKPIYTLSNILTQLEKSPERINVKLSSNKKKLSAPVVSLLSLLPPAKIQSKFQGNRSYINTNKKTNISSLDNNEMKNYLNELSKFLSKGWEVPIHLKESQVTVAIMFEIDKNGKILNWKLEESRSPSLHNSVNNLMKNLKYLPALPESYPENSYIFGVRFSPTIPKK